MLNRHATPPVTIDHVARRRGRNQAGPEVPQLRAGRPDHVLHRAHPTPIGLRRRQLDDRPARDDRPRVGGPGNSEQHEHHGQRPGQPDAGERHPPHRATRQQHDTGPLPMRHQTRQGGRRHPADRYGAEQEAEGLRRAAELVLVVGRGTAPSASPARSRIGRRGRHRPTRAPGRPAGPRPRLLATPAGSRPMPAPPCAVTSPRRARRRTSTRRSRSRRWSPTGR